MTTSNNSPDDVKSAGKRDSRSNPVVVPRTVGQCQPNTEPRCHPALSGTDPVMARGTGVRCTEPVAHHLAVQRSDEVCGGLNADELVEGFRRHHRMNKQQQIASLPVTTRQVRLMLLILPVTTRQVRLMLLILPVTTRQVRLMLLILPVTTRQVRLILLILPVTTRQAVSYTHLTLPTKRIV